jgi:hypothetical protein
VAVPATPPPPNPAASPLSRKLHPLQLFRASCHVVQLLRPPCCCSVFDLTLPTCFQSFYPAATQLLRRRQYQPLCDVAPPCYCSVSYLILPTGFPAATATQLLRRRQYQPRHRRQILRLTLLAASFAALKLHPPQLFRAIGELFKQQRQQLKLLGPTESMLLLWAFGRVRHRDAPAQLLLTQRATTQVG